MTAVMFRWRMSDRDKADRIHQLSQRRRRFGVGPDRETDRTLRIRSVDMQGPQGPVLEIMSHNAV
jgi:hypothetical protein